VAVPFELVVRVPAAGRLVLCAVFLEVDAELSGTQCVPVDTSPGFWTCAWWSGRWAAQPGCR